MGTVFPRQSDNMKLIAVLALAAVAFAEPEADPKADPWLTYGAYGYPYAGVYGGYRTYGAYPYSYGYYGKRSADAEPEAEADPAVLYSTAHVAAPLTTAYTHAVAAPLTYTHAVAAPAVTYTAAVPTVATTAVNTVVPSVASTVYSHAYPYVYGKRSADAEADPALLYTAGVAPLAYTHHAVAAPGVAAYTVPVATVAKAPAHGVAATYAGLVHSSHVGVCLNNVGVQVPC